MKATTTRAGDEREALLADYVELNMSNYDQDDVSRLNEWAIRAYAALSARTGAAVSGPVEPAYLRLRKAADEVCACLGYHGEISNRDDRVVALVDALYGTDDGSPETAKPVYCTESSALKALRNLRDALRDRHYGRMPDEVQKAYEEASSVISDLSAERGSRHER